MKMDLPAPVARALSELERSGHQGYVVGGCVRDSLMGRTPGDYDITTSALPEQVQACFSGERVVPTGIKHGTVTVILDGMPLEITTFRADGEYSDHRRPDSVSFSTRLEDDLCRRDFTINAMAYSPQRGLIDLYGGVADISAGVVRCVGDAVRRFDEDALRMLRAVRFAASLEFDIDPATLMALNERLGDIAYVARERVFTELNKALNARSPVRALATGQGLVLCALGIEASELDVANLEWLKPARARMQEGYALALELVKRVKCEGGLRWAALLAPLGAERAEHVLRGLRAPNDIIERACAAISGAARPFGVERAEVLRMLNALGVDGLNDALALARAAADCGGDAARCEMLDAAAAQARRAVDAGACYTLRQLAIGGRELSALGLKGRAVGAMLEQLLNEVMAGDLPNEAAALVARAKEAVK